MEEAIKEVESQEAATQEVPSEAPASPGSKLKLLRSAAGLSQRELGLAIDATTQFVSNVERDVTPVPFAMVPALAVALKTTQNEIALYALESTRAYKTFLKYNVVGNA